MSVIFTGTNQGTFTSTGAPVTIQLTSGFDYMWVKNRTVSYAGGAGTGAEFYWQLGMTQGQGTIYTKTSATNALAVAQIAANSGFFLVNSTVNVPGASVATTAVSNANPPLVSTGSTAGLIANSSIVRLYNQAGTVELNGLDFTVGAIVANTTFALAYGPTSVTGSGSAAGSYRIIPYNPYFYPNTRYITNVSNASQAIVTLSVTHGYTVGQNVRFLVPTVSSTTYGMTQLNGLSGNIVAIGQADVNGYTNTITVDIDTTAFSTFTFPLNTDPGFTPAQVIPIGENTSVALNYGQNILADATVNTGYLGMMLMAGANSPAGVNGNVIDWVVGKSFNT